MLKRFYCYILLFITIFTTLYPGITGAVNKEIIVLNVDGPIVPVIETYIDRGISMAEEMNALACIIKLNTPGGLLHTTQVIVQRIMGAEVPVIIYVSPAGGWAASAGMFITISSHVASMAPGTRIGAAHPVAGQGQELPEAQQRKITEDATAWARSIAETRDRNADVAALTVIESKSYTDKEAFESNLIDLRSPNLDSLLQNIDGRKIILDNREIITLDTAEASLNHIDMTTSESFLQTISNPNVSYILMMLGMLGLVLEFYNPGMIFPGVAGGISLLIALYSLGTLNASWSGVLLIIMAFALFAAEVFVTSYGLLSIGGIISLIAGSMMLFGADSPMPGVNIGLIAGTVVSVTAFMTFAVRAVIKSQRKKVVTGHESFEGAKGRAITDLNPVGTVIFQGERWEAVAEEDKIDAGARVVVIRLEGLKLYVRKADNCN